jgi:predicted transglutaminase-like cysteine proteinase
MRQAQFGQETLCAHRSAPSRAFLSITDKVLRIGLLVFTLVIGGAATHAQTLVALPSAQPIERSGTARPVQAWLKLCERQPEECRVNPSEPASIELTPQVWRTIVSVNRRVNTRIKPLTDKEHWGVVDSWDFPDDGYGDCEDYQLLKRKLLTERGLPRRTLRMTVVIDEQGEGHAVLMVRTTRGDFILDNKTNAVLPWNQTGYTFVKREGDDNSTWASLGGLASPVSTANR